jgi:hypothetical protein
MLCGLALTARSSMAGQDPAVPPAGAAATDLLIAIDGPPPPEAPDVISRDGSGRATLRATRVTTPIRVDGQLDEAIYQTVPPISGFIQNDPHEGDAATEKTDVWILFDGDNVYVTARCWETHPERMVANEMRRDSPNIVQNDAFAFSFDTFYDRRNAVLFEVNAIGGRIDAQVTNERQVNMDWNPIWDFHVGRFEGGWTLETAIPFKSLRYRPGRAQVWGFNARRTNRWKNEVSYLTRIPASLTLRGHFQASLMAAVVGLEAPSTSRNLEIKPYGISQLTADRTTTPAVADHVDANWGLDVKYGVTRGLTADFTYNTDFAQVEADEQQVNLTRFSLLFPEKREFFLENQGIFAFGGTLGIGGGGGGGGGQGGGGGAGGNSSDTPLLFYSRRIGLSNLRPVPINGGGRLTGRVDRYSVGVLNIQSGREPITGMPSSNFSVARLKRDILRKSSIGAIFTGRSVSENGVGSNQAYGFDGAFSFYDNLSINTYWAKTRSDGVAGGDTSYRGQLDYGGDRYGVQLERLAVGDQFNPEVGFVRRHDMLRNFGLLRFSPRPHSNRRIRRFSWTGSFTHIENGAGRVETRDWQGEFAIEFQNSDRVSVDHSDVYEFLPVPFEIASGITLPVQGYQYASTRSTFTLGQQRRIAGNFSVEHGTFYSGHKTTVSWSRGRVNMTPQLSVEPRISVDRVDLAEGSFTTRLVGSRVVYTVTPMMFISTLVQYNSATNVLAANVRLRWEYRPGSELFIVWNEQRDTLSTTFPELANRAFVVKINRLFRF